LYVFPLLLAFRGLHPTMAPLPGIQHANLLDRSEQIRGSECIVLERRLGAGLAKQRLCIDPKCDYCIRRFWVTSGDKDEVQIDIEYREEDHEWQPTSWKSTSLSTDGHLFESLSAEVTQHELNPALNDDTFALPFPAGTLVVDNNLPSGHNIYIVQQDGSNKFVSGPPLADSSLQEWLGSWWHLGLGLMLVCTGGIYWLRNRSQMRKAVP
jgi:hypothetical protein